MKPSSSPRIAARRYGWRLHFLIIGFVALFLAYAIFVLTEQADTNESVMGPLPVRTDLMSDQACHVANATIMGNCSEAEIAALQREHDPSATD